MLNRRQNTLLISTSSSPEWANAYTATMYPVGAVVTSAATSTTIAVAKGHSCIAGDNVLVDPTSGAVFETVASVTGTTVVVNNAVTVTVGMLVVNLGADTGSGSPNYDGSPMGIYTDAAGATLATNAKVTASATGEYSYFHRSDGLHWELVRDSSGTVQDVITGFSSKQGRLNVCDFGARPTTTDQQPRINAAVVALNSEGGEVYAPEGVYVLDAQLALDQPNVVLSGDGSLDKTSSGASTKYVTVFDFNTADEAVHISEFNVTMRDITIRAESGGTSDVGILIDNESAGSVIFRTLLENVAVESFTSYGIKATEPESLVIDRCIVRLTSDAGLYITGTSGVGINVVVRDSRIHFCSGEYSVYIATMIQVKFDNVEVLDCAATKDLVQTTGVQELRFINCDFERPSDGDGLVIDKGGNLVVENCFFGTMNRAIVLTGASGNELNGASIVHNRFASDVTTALVLDGGGDINALRVFGNRFNSTNVATTPGAFYDETVLVSGTSVFGAGVTELDSSAGAFDFTVGHGFAPGEIRTVYMTADGGDVTCTVTNHITSDPELFYFKNVDEYLVLLWAGHQWVTLQNNGVDTTP